MALLATKLYLIFVGKFISEIWQSIFKFFFKKKIVFVQIVEDSREHFEGQNDEKQRIYFALGTRRRAHSFESVRGRAHHRRMTFGSAHWKVPGLSLWLSLCCVLFVFGTV